MPTSNYNSHPLKFLPLPVSPELFHIIIVIVILEKNKIKKANETWRKLKVINQK
jgi:hypothetical protein